MTKDYPLVGLSQVGKCRHLKLLFNIEIFNMIKYERRDAIKNIIDITLFTQETSKQHLSSKEMIKITGNKANEQHFFQGKSV